MFFSKLNQSNPAKPMANVKVKTVKVKKTPPSNPLSKPSSTTGANKSSSIKKRPRSETSSSSTSSATKRQTTENNSSSNSNKSYKISRESSVEKSVRQAPRRKSRAPDLSMFNRASSDEEIDDSNWEAEFNRFSSSATPSSPSVATPLGKISTDTPPLSDDNFASTPINKIEDTRVVYSGKWKHVNVINAVSLKKFAEYIPVFKDNTNLEYELAMPSTIFREKYFACTPKSPEEFNPILETEQVMELVALYFVPPEYTNTIKHPSLEDCIVRRYRRAIKAGDSKKFLEAITEYNQLIDRLRKNGTIANHLKEMTKLPTAISRFLLNQVYARVVSPVANQLRDYKAFSNNVYGELLPDFISTIFKQTGLTSKMVFIDLGSGVGNCTLQAALEIGCESWGCEVMKTASSLATKQQAEMEERVKMYGLKIGSINLISEDFVESDLVHKKVSEADVLLINNYAFDGKLNSHLLDMFLDLKEGARIVSLKSFVPPGHVISEHNIQSPANLLSVEKMEFPSGSVSWTIAPGPYFISTVDRSRLEKFFKSRGMN